MLVAWLAALVAPWAAAQDYLPQPQGRTATPPVAGPQLTRIDRSGAPQPSAFNGVPPPVLQRLPATPARPMLPLPMQPVEYPEFLPAPPLPQEQGVPTVDRRLPFMMQQSLGGTPPAAPAPRAAAAPVAPVAAPAIPPPIPAPTFAPEERVAPPAAPPVRDIPEPRTGTAPLHLQSSMPPRVAPSAMRPPAAPPPAWTPATAPGPVWASGPAPVSTLPPAAGGGDFVIGVADVLSITVVGEPELSLEADVSTSGEVNLPLVGGLPVVGLTPAAASQRIKSAYIEGQYLLAPQVQVRVLQSRNLMISVLGEVRQPGRFAAPTQMSVLDALALAGGIADSGGHRVTVLREEGGRLQRREIDLTGLASGNDPTGSSPLMLRPGDTVMVPEAARFYIYGEVRSPNAYPLKPGMTVMQALALGGGANDRGSRKRIEIQRQTASGVVETHSASLADPVQPDDVIYIRERLF